MTEGPGKVKKERARKCGPESFIKDDGAEEDQAWGSQASLIGTALAGQVALKWYRLGDKMMEVYEIKSNTRLQRRGN